MDKKTQKFDFCGWATRNNVRCSDGRVIRKDSFKHNDGQSVPLVWNHNHQSADNVLGHALLENREEGVYAYCSFNETQQGKDAKELVRHGDICSLSIYANQLQQNGSDVIHGTIREVSLVLAGANPGAKIENVMAHGAEDPEQAILFNSDETFEFDVEKEIIHAEEKQADEQPKQPEKSGDEKTVKEVFDSFTEDQKTVVYAMIGAAVEAAKKGENPDVQHSDEDKTVEEVFNTFTEEQKTVVYALIGAALEEQRKNQEEEHMKQNAFEQDANNGIVIAHSEIVETFEKAKKTGSLRDAVNELCLAHSIENIDVLFPEVKAINNMPKTINDDTKWVNKVMSRVHHTPFSKVKMLAFDITGEEARARGYIKGNKKEEEVIAALRRETSPQTIYKLQKMDRDDIIDITDFDVVAYLKQEMRGKLDEELARAILTGDGRSAASKDKINPLHIRPILGDDSTYVVAKYLQRGDMDDPKFAKFFIKEQIRARKDYKGSGNPVLFTSEEWLTEMLLIEDKNERVIYDTMDKLKTALRVSDIVTVPYFSNLVRTEGKKQYKLMGIVVNLDDYNVGADKGGAVNMFDDFDLDYNKYEYLIETRCSGAMVQPYGALTFEEEVNFQPASE